MIAHLIALLLALVAHLSPATPAPAPGVNPPAGVSQPLSPGVSGSKPAPAPASVPVPELVDEPPAVSDVPADWDGPATDSPMCTPPDVDPAVVDCWTDAGE